ERAFLFIEELPQALVDQAFEFIVGQGRVVEPRAQDLDQALLHLDPDLGHPVLLLALGQPVCEGHLGSLLGFVANSWRTDASSSWSRPPGSPQARLLGYLPGSGRRADAPPPPPRKKARPARPDGPC